MPVPTLRYALLLLLGLAVLTPPRAFGQAAALPRPTLAATRTATPPRIDGDLDDAVWAQAPVVTDFTQRSPNVGRPASQRTEVRLLYDEGALYVAARLFDTAPDSIAATLFRRDEDSYSDWFFVMVDSYHDRRTAFFFEVSPRGVKSDRLKFNDVDEDQSWDAVWDAATRMDDQGWTAELKIPLSQLRFSASSQPQTWGINFQRRIARRQEFSYWSPTPAEAGGIVSRFGDLTGLVLPRPPRRVELMPYVAAGVTRTPASLFPGGDASPFYHQHDPQARVGGDLKMGLPAGFTLTATVNPDFGQVEADPAVVNLSAFETFFQERRPFFVEGTDVFSFGNLRAFNRYSVPTLLYTRRIGRAPQRSLFGPGVAFVDAPVQTPIAVAAKVSGQAAGWSVGVLDAFTREETGRYVLGTGEERTAAVEPPTNYFVGRLRRNLSEATTVGAVGTAVNRRLDDALRPLLREAAYLGGADFLHFLDARKRWLVSGYAVGTQVRGDSLAILSLQRSSARYYQRPDADYLEVDPSRTSLGGHMAALALVKAGGQHWLGSLVAQQISPGFEVNDLGFFSRADSRSLATSLRYRETRPGPVFRNFQVGGFSTHAWSYGGENIFQHVGLNFGGQLTNYWGMNVGLQYNPEFTNLTLTRGGPSGRVPAQFFVQAGGISDTRKKVAVEFGGGWRTDTSGEYDRFVEVGAAYRPTSAVQASFGMGFSSERDTDQFIRSVADANATATFGRRYVISDVDGTGFGLSLRVDWTFSPSMSLQLYAAPGLEVNRFHTFKEFRMPGTFDFDVYGQDRGTITLANGNYTVDPDGAGSSAPFTFNDPDFTFRSFRSNAVFRWEYRPGSTLFLVWQRAGERDFSRTTFDAVEITDAFSQPARDVLLVKLTYWIGR